MQTAAWPKVGGARYSLSVDEPFTFGRSESCTVALDPDDVTISASHGPSSTTKTPGG